MNCSLFNQTSKLSSYSEIICNIAGIPRMSHGADFYFSLFFST